MQNKTKQIDCVLLVINCLLNADDPLSYVSEEATEKKIKINIFSLYNADTKCVLIVVKLHGIL